MNTIISFTLSDLWMGVLSVCGMIAALGGAVALIVKLIKWLKKPNTLQDKSIAELQDDMSMVKTRLDAHDAMLANDKRSIDAFRAEQREENRSTKRALLALLDHSLDGNNIAQMETAKQGLLDSLIDK